MIADLRHRLHALQANLDGLLWTQGHKPTPELDERIAAQERHEARLLRELRSQGCWMREGKVARV